MDELKARVDKDTLGKRERQLLMTLWKQFRTEWKERRGEFVENFKSRPI